MVSNGFMGRNLKCLVFYTFVLAALFVPVLHGQGVSLLPGTVPLSEVEIRLTVSGGDGCFGRCTNYSIVIRGDGLVQYDDVAQPPLPRQTRRVPVDEVVSLVNEFVRARFFEAPHRFVGTSFYKLEDDRLQLNGSGSAGRPNQDLSFRLGPLQKSVYLYMEYPDYLARLRDLVVQMGGPKAWAQQ